MFGNSCNLNFHCLAPRDSEELLPTSLTHREPVILNVYDMASPAFINLSPFCEKHEKFTIWKMQFIYL